MSTRTPARIGILWRGTRDAPPSRTEERLRPVFDSLTASDIAVTPVPFDDEFAGDVRQQLLALDGVLVWVDPVMGDRDRAVLDEMLRDVAGHGVWVSAHPDVIEKIGTKEVLVLTRDLSCGSDTYVYRTAAALRAEFPDRLRKGARVLKQHRGNAGIGVWKVNLAGGEGALVEVQDAHPRGTDIETIALSDFIDRCGPCFEGDGYLVDQPFQPRIAEGLVRCYLVQDRVAGFARQQPDAAQLASGRVFGLPSSKTMHPPTEPAFASLKESMERTWLPALQQLADIETNALPMLWDADFFYGPKDETGNDTYVLCEINASCIVPFPDTVPAMLARAVVDRVR
jgi:hypothetical protein